MQKHRDLIFENLNEQQQQAVSALKGPVLILAGAGSGKTRALTHRIAHLIAGGTPPPQILAVTFTNKAAREMQERIVNLLHLTEGTSAARAKFMVSSSNHEPALRRGNWYQSPHLPVMGTFHSICSRILRRDIEAIGRNRNFVIYDTSDQESLMKEVLKEFSIDVKELKASTGLGHIGRFKCEALSPHEVTQEATTEFMTRIAKIYEAYQKKLRACNAVDFDDLILETIRLFTEVPQVLERYQDTWQFLNIDEYQDTNHAQYLLISLLARKYRNLCVIGDPDQSIYAFRGADIRNILQFQAEYKDAVSVKLERNYRSVQPILDAADAVIAANPNRPEKKMWTHRIDGEKITVYEVSDEKREADEAVKLVMAALARGTPLNEQVILYRTNAQSRLFEEACLRHALPYRIVGGVRFYARREVKDILAYLHAIHNPEDTVSTLRIINVPSRKIGATTLERIQAFAMREQLSLWQSLQRVNELTDLALPVQRRIQEFVSLIEKYRERKLGMTVSLLTRELLAEIKLEDWIKDGTSEGEDRWQNIGELLTVMQKYDGLEPEQSFLSFLEEVSLVSEVDALSPSAPLGINSTRTDALTLMTLHLCKGLEFQHVVIAGCEEGIFPHSSAMFDRSQLEEERRLMYVGMTRAKDELHIFFTRSRMLWGTTQANAPSRFLDDLPPEVTERRSDDLLSAHAWKSSVATTRESSRQHISAKNIRALRERERLERIQRKQHVAIDFHQDVHSLSEDVNQDAGAVPLQIGARIRHRVFGEGTVTQRRGDVVDVAFDSGKKKRLALSIAPLEAL